ncbi:phosphoglycerate mutase-like protein [Sphaerulina musiva SO2202]|uniref:Phosphoglycerate mutase-like protein n=1 Tax=Sphaerulina musiva (strain SO2202) TaxID=692275 RepID=M3D4J2_SPHMS|nr:phosphoglycerate mutase-like protein [Sphaerulina musiva SO2202]EMF12799.1 phosphoglycerate mutase-like protein [Sphaerulina musiva SO2202]
MSPILHVMRHGQGYHSSAVTKDGHLLRDPFLTEKGKQQCRDRCKAFTRHGHIELLVASPMRRAIQTCQLSFQPAVERGLVIVCLPHAEEVSDAPADTGSPVNVLQAEFGSAVNFDHLEEGWFKHDGEFAIDPKAVKARATKLRQWLKARPEKEIAMVSHGFFNHYLCEEVDDDGQQTTPWWNEAELRTYTFSDDENDNIAKIYETPESLTARGASAGNERPMSPKVNIPSTRGSNPDEHYIKPDDSATASR